MAQIAKLWRVGVGFRKRCVRLEVDVKQTFHVGLAACDVEQGVLRSLSDLLMDLRCELQQHSCEVEGFGLRPDAGESYLMRAHSHIEDIHMKLMLWSRVKGWLREICCTKLSKANLSSIGIVGRHFAVALRRSHVHTRISRSCQTVVETVLASLPRLRQLQAMPSDYARSKMGLCMNQ